MYHVYYGAQFLWKKYLVCGFFRGGGGNEQVYMTIGKIINTQLTCIFTSMLFHILAVLVYDYSNSKTLYLGL